MDRFRLTARQGPQVERDEYANLDEAVAALQLRAERVVAAGPLKQVSMLRDFEPRRQVAARLEISTGPRRRRRVAGVDVMGDGSLVPYRAQAGLAGRRPLRSGPKTSATMELVRQELSE